MSSKSLTTLDGGSRKAAWAVANDPMGVRDRFGPMMSDGKDDVCCASGDLYCDNDGGAAAADVESERTLFDL